MELSKIVTYGHDVLRTRAQEVDGFTEEIRELIGMMYVGLVEYRGLGLAAPQVGVSKRIFVYDVGEGPHALINPQFISLKGEEWGIEGCLSIPGLQGDVPRYEKVTVTGIDENGNRIRIKAEGLLARVFQHETDHLDGMLFVDRADPDTLETVPLRDDDDEDADVESQSQSQSQSQH